MDVAESEDGQTLVPAGAHSAGPDSVL